MSNKTFIEAPFSPVFSNNPLVDSLNYDTSSLVSNKFYILNNKIINFFNIKKTNDINILRGKRDGAPKFLNTTY